MILTSLVLVQDRPKIHGLMVNYQVEINHGQPVLIIHELGDTGQWATSQA